MSEKLTEDQAIILTGFTGILCCKNFSTFHKDVEQRLGRPVWTHEFADMRERLKELYRNDFLALIPESNDD